MQSFGKEEGWENLGVITMMTAKDSEGRSSQWCQLCGSVLRLLTVAIQWSNNPCFYSLYRKIIRQVYKLSWPWSIGWHRELFYTGQLQKGITLKKNKQKKNPPPKNYFLLLVTPKFIVGRVFWSLLIHNFCHVTKWSTLMTHPLQLVLLRASALTALGTVTAGDWYSMGRLWPGGLYVEEIRGTRRCRAAFEFC